MNKLKDFLMLWDDEIILSTITSTAALFFLFMILHMNFWLIAITGVAALLSLVFMVVYVETGMYYKIQFSTWEKRLEQEAESKNQELRLERFMELCKQK